MAPKNNKKEEATMKNRILMSREEKKVGSGSGSGRRSVEFKKHIYEVAKEKNPELEITVESIEIMNEMMNNVLHKIVEEAAKNAAAASSNQKILIPKDLWVGVKKLFPRDLAKYANVHAYVACTTFETNVAHERAVNERESQQLADYLAQVKI